MIEVLIKDSPDLLSLGKHTFPFENVTFGQKLKNSLIIDDNRIEDNIVRLKLTKDCLYLIAPNFLKLNSKKVKGKIKLRVTDKITLGQTTIEITNFDASLIETSEQYYEQLTKLAKEDPLSYSIVEFFENEYALKLGTINVMEE